MDLYRTIPNLRRISICAWNDYALAAEGIGADYVYSIKPDAVSISRPTWTVETDVRAIESILDQSEGCCREIIHNEIAHSCQLDAIEWSQRPTVHKLLENLFLLMTPVL